MSYNPYEGLKPNHSGEEEIRLLVAMSYNPYEGLKQTLGVSEKMNEELQCPIIPMRD